MTMTVFYFISGMQYKRGHSRQALSVTLRCFQFMDRAIIFEMVLITNE